MAAAVRLRADYDAPQLRELAKRSADAAQTRRLLALAAIYDGGSRTEAATIGGVGLQTVRDWVLAFNAEGPAGLINGKAPGNAPLLTPAHRQALLEIVESGPNPAVHGVEQDHRKQDHPTLGAAWHLACGAARLTHPLGLHLRRHLPGSGERRRPRSYDDILGHCCFAWNKLVDQPSTIIAIGLRDWAHRF
jgi:transposase